MWAFARVPKRLAFARVPKRLQRVLLVALLNTFQILLQIHCGRFLQNSREHLEMVVRCVANVRLDLTKLETM